MSEAIEKVEKQPEYKDSAANLALVKALEQLTQSAREGKVIGLITAAISTEDIPCARITHLMDVHAFQMIGQLEICKRDLLTLCPSGIVPASAPMSAAQNAEIEKVVKSVIQKAGPKIIGPRGNA